MGVNFLKFPVTGSILSTYNTGINTDLFDTSDNTFIFYVSEGGYAPISIDIGERQVVVGASSVMPQYPTYFRGFEATTLDERGVTKSVLNELRITALGTAAKTVTVHDYIEPDSGIFTIRELYMSNPVRSKGTSFTDPRGDVWYKGGFDVELLALGLISE